MPLAKIIVKIYMMQKHRPPKLINRCSLNNCKHTNTTQAILSRIERKIVCEEEESNERKIGRRKKKEREE